MQCMDRTALEGMLDEGLSLAEIARRSSLHESTVGYWVNKHGLRAVNRDKHAARGPLSRGELARLVGEGASIAEIADAVGRSKVTVRHWLRQYGLRTERAARRNVVREDSHARLVCARHGITEFSERPSSGRRCLKCRSEAVTQRRRRVKRRLVEEAGGQCVVCGYKRCVAALEFHHVVPSDKRFSLSDRGVARSMARARSEASKCVLLCANCHAEVEAGMMRLTTADRASLQSRQDPGISPG
jgi:transposase